MTASRIRSAANRWILAYGTDAEVADPDQLREALRQEAESLAEMLVPGRRPLATVAPAPRPESRRRPAKAKGAVE